MASVGIYKYSDLTTKICSRWKKRLLFERERLHTAARLLFLPPAPGLPQKLSKRTGGVVCGTLWFSSAWAHLTTSRRPPRICVIHSGQEHQRVTLFFIKGSGKHRSEQKKPYWGRTRPNQQRRRCRGYVVSWWHSFCTVSKQNARCYQGWKANRERGLSATTKRQRSGLLVIPVMAE